MYRRQHLLAYELQKKAGLPLRDGILSNEELVEELCQLKLKHVNYTYVRGNCI